MPSDTSSRSAALPRWRGMVDHFALLNEPRRPWVDPDQLKNKFLAYSAEAHPDHAHGGSEQEKLAANQRFAELTAAYNCLRDPKERLLHLLELELGKKPEDVERMTPGDMELFFQVGQTCRAVDAFLAGKPKVPSPMLKVRWVEQALKWIDQLNALQQAIQAPRAQILDELKTMNARWESALQAGSSAQRRLLPLDRLEQIYRILSYLSRWAEQIQARAVQLSLY